MKNICRITISLFCFAVLLWQCKDKYVSPYPSPATGYLVVEGYISGNGPTQFTLSRTISLPGNKAIPMETGARLQVEGDDNTIYPFTEQGKGVYSIDTLALGAGVKYRLRINTSNGKSYLSDYVAVRPTPAIDSISWLKNEQGVQVYANTHDPANATHYYLWAYDETWEYNSARASSFQFLHPPDTVIPRTQQIYTCWKGGPSNDLFLGNSTKLSQDLIFEQPLVLIPSNDQKLGVEYSILVRQYALTEDGYNYLTLMQKNSESLGSIFDAQPSVLKGNIHCQSNPTEQVIGYISAGTVQQQRIFIREEQVLPWNYAASCPMADTLVSPNIYSLDQFYLDMGYMPIQMHFGSTGYFDGWTSNISTCVDCTLQGGTNIKPSFWQN